MHYHGVRIGGRRVVTQRIDALAGHYVGRQWLTGIEIEHFGIGRYGAAFADETVDALLSYAGHRKIVRDAELVSRRLQQPVANLQILFGAVKRRLRREQCRQHQQEQLHFTFLPVMRTGELIVAVIQKAQAEAAIRAGGNNGREADPVSS